MRAAVCAKSHARPLPSALPLLNGNADLVWLGHASLRFTVDVKCDATMFVVLFCHLSRQQGRVCGTTAVVHSRAICSISTLVLRTNLSSSRYGLRPRPVPFISVADRQVRRPFCTWPTRRLPPLCFHRQVLRGKHITTQQQQSAGSPIKQDLQQ